MPTLEPAAPLETRACLRYANCPGPGAPVVASTDYMKAYAEQIRLHFLGRSYKCWAPTVWPLSDFRAGKLREHFEINRHYIVVARRALADQGLLPRAKVAEANASSTASPPTRPTCCA